MKESSLCFLAQDYLDNLNLSCAFLASNTTEFGFGAISSYFIENIMYITKKVFGFIKERKKINLIK